MAKAHGIFRPFWTESGPDGERVRRTSKAWAYRFEFAGRTYQKGGFETASAASAARDTRRAELRAGQEQDWRKLTVGAIHQRASAHRVEWAPGTAINFDVVWARLFRHFPPEDIVAMIDETRLLEYVRARKAVGAAVNTIRVDLGHLRTAMRLAHAARLLPWVPTFPRLKYQRREQVVAPVTLDQILEHMPGHFRLLLLVAQAMGWRVQSEIATRRWSDIDWGPDVWSCCQISVRADACPQCGVGRPGWVWLDAASSKTGQRRAFPITRRLRALLVEARAACDRAQGQARRIIPWVFCQENGARVPSYRKSWTAALAKVGVGKLAGRSGPWSSGLVVHDIRRATIRRLRSDGVERGARKDLVGHASDSAHAIYEASGQDLDALRAAACLMDRQEDATPDNVVQLSLFRKGR